MTLFAQQTIKVVPDHELDTWDYSFKDLTATVQFKSMQLTFANTDLQKCKEFQGKLTEAKNIFGTARIPADNLINALLAGGYQLIKTEINRPSTTTIPRDPWISSALNGSDKRLMSDMHNVPCGGVLSNSATYRVGEASTVDEWNKAGSKAISEAPADARVSRNAVYTINLSNPGKDDSFADAVMAAFIDLDKRGR